MHTTTGNTTPASYSPSIQRSSSSWKWRIFVLPATLAPPERSGRHVRQDLAREQFEALVEEGVGDRAVVEHGQVHV